MSQINSRDPWDEKMSTDTVIYFQSMVEYNSLQSMVERGRKGEERQGSREGGTEGVIFLTK